MPCKEIRERLAELLSPFERERGSLLAILQRVQASFGYLPREAMLEVARFLRVSESTVYGVATFYNQFHFTPRGRHPIRVCMGTACHIRGGRVVLEAVERELDIEVGGTTPDGEFSLDRVACIGCCVIAPVLVIGDVVYPKMTPARVEEVLIPFRHELQRDSVSDKAGVGSPPEE